MAVREVLDMTNALDHLPNLRHISLRYIDGWFSHIFEELKLGTFPQQVTHLSIGYSFTLPLLPFVHWLHWIFRDHAVTRALLPNLRHLSLSGVMPAFAAAMLQVCLNVETLEIIDPTHLCWLGPLPPAVRTLVLHHLGIALSRGHMALWKLSEALDEGLFPESTKPPRIVIRSGIPDPDAFMDIGVHLQAIQC